MTTHTSLDGSQAMNPWEGGSQLPDTDPDSGTASLTCCLPAFVDHALKRRRVFDIDFEQAEDKAGMCFIEVENRSHVSTQDLPTVVGVQQTMMRSVLIFRG